MLNYPYQSLRGHERKTSLHPAITTQANRTRPKSTADRKTSASGRVFCCNFQDAKDAYPYPDPLTLAQAYFPSWMQERAREILASDSRQAAIEYLAQESVKISPGGFNRVMSYQTKPGRKVRVYAMTEKKIFWDEYRVYRLEALADALLAKAGQLNLF